MYYPDLTVYSYSRFPEKLKEQGRIGEDSVCYNVGWLDYHYDYPVGFVGDDFLLAFQEFVKNAENRMRGYHVCQFCKYKKLLANENDDSAFDRTTAEIAGNVYHLGCKEIVVPGENCVYICPDIILHYMKEHVYRPPAAFCQAVLPGVEMPQILSLSSAKRKPCWKCSQKEAILEDIRPQVSELHHLMLTLIGFVDARELESIVPNYGSLVSRLENISLIDQCPEICSRKELYKLFDGIGEIFSKAHRLLPSSEAVTLTTRSIYPVLNEVIRKTAG